MPTADAVLLPLCIGLTLVGLVVTVVAFRRGRRGRAVQGLALALAPVALYLTGLLRLLWDAVVAVGRWASGSVFGVAAGVGFGVLALCVVLWVVGGVVARRTPRPAKPVEGRTEKGAPAAAPRQVASGRGSRKAGAQADRDPEMDEIEALLKSRGIS